MGFVRRVQPSALFDAPVFSMLLDAGLINEDLVEQIRSWEHKGFHAWIGPPISDAQEIAQIGMYTVRALAAEGRLVLDEGPRLNYYVKGTRPDRDIGGVCEPQSESFDYLDWIAWLTSHIPDRGAQLTHYYGAYANAHRGERKKECDGAPQEGAREKPSAESEEEWIRSRRRTWARLVKQVYEVDPLLCECGATLELIDVIEARTQSDLVGKILKHVNYAFDALPLPEHPPLSFYPEPGEAQDDGSLPDAYCF